METQELNTIKKMMQEKGIQVNKKLEKIVQSDDYEIFENGIDLIAKNTGLQCEDIENVMDWLGCNLNEEKLYEDYLSIGSYNNYMQLDNGNVIFYNED